MEIAEQQNIRKLLHQINNNLFVLSGRVEMLLQEETNCAGVKKDLKIISEQIEKIKDSIKELRQTCSLE